MNTDTNNVREVEIPDELKELVIARLNLIPDGVKISIGSDGEFTRAQLIEKVEREDRVGREIVRSQLEFLRALGNGTLIDELTSQLTE